jgi:hypothetical protein
VPLSGDEELSDQEQNPELFDVGDEDECHEFIAEDDDEDTCSICSFDEADPIHQDES